MKKFGDWWKEKFQCPPSGHVDEPPHWSLQRLAHGFVEYVEEVINPSNSAAWDKYKLRLTGLSPEELDILGADYEVYRKDWRPEYGKPLSFGDWYIFMADNAKENREGK